jgi:uncharacterized membrane protein
MDNRQIEISKNISYGWTSVKKDFWYFIGLTVIMVIIEGLGGSDRSTNVFDALGIFLSAWMTCGAMTLFLSYQRGQKLPIEKLFTSVKKYWEVLGATILVGLIVAVGFIALIVPGLYLALRFQFVIPLIIDKNLDIGAAMKESTRLTNGIKMALFRFDLALLGVIILGAICLGVGVFVAMPVAYLAYIQVYRGLA